MAFIPTVQDYPDFTRLSQFTSAAILDVTSTATGTPTILGTFYTGGFESLVVRSFNQAAGVGWVYTFKWFTDQALTKEIGQVNLRTLSAVPISGQIPNRGPWCQVSVNTTSVVAHAFSLLVIPRTGTPSGAGSFLDGLINGGFGQAIAAGGTFNQNAFQLTPGPASFTVHGATSPWAAGINGFDELGAGVGTFGAIFGGANQGASARIILPTIWTQLFIINTGGVGGSYSYSVQADL